MTDTKWRIGKSFAKYEKQARTPLDPKRLPFLIGAVPVGSVAEEDARLISGRVSRFAFDGRSLALDDAGMDRDARSEVLAIAAAVLREERSSVKWRDELLDVRRDSSSPVLAVLERGVFRALGLITLAVHMNGISPDGRIWTSRRAASKAVNPGKWDNLAAGMVSAGEIPVEAIRREAYEEAGLSDSGYELTPEARFFNSHPTESGWLREATFCYRAKLAPGVEPRNIDGEVDAMELLSADEMAELVARGKVTSEASLVALHWLAEATGKELPAGFYKPLV